MFLEYFVFALSWCSAVQKGIAGDVVDAAADVVNEVASDVDNVVVVAANVSNNICGEGHSDYDTRPMPGLKKKLKLMRLDCGQVCDTTVEPTRKSKYYDFIEKNVDCLALFESPVLELTELEAAPKDRHYKPPNFCDLPKQLRDLFTHGGKLQVVGMYMDDFKWSVKEVNWPSAGVELYRRQFREGILNGTYGKHTVDNMDRHLRDFMQDTVKGGHILVIGSQSPWIEAILLEHGADHVTTLEYNPVWTDHPNLTVVLPEKLNEMVLNGEIGPEGRQFDGVVTFSSVEHSGLGRYGDHLNPWGDLIAMSKAWCLTKPGGRMLIGVPTGEDMLLFNGCRLYGHFLYSHLFANWEVVYTEAEISPKKYAECGALYCYEPIHILEKPKQE